MPSYKVNGIITRYADYKDYDRMLTLFTRELGMVSVSSRGCRRPRSALLAASEQFASGEFVLFKTGEKYSLDSADIRETFYPLREDYLKLASASYMAAIINSDVLDSAGADEASREILSLFMYALSYLAYSDADPVDMAICFAAKALDMLGYRPSVTNCASCGRDIRRDARILFSSAEGGALCEGCAMKLHAQAMDISPLSLEALRRMLLLGAADIKKVVLPEKVRRELKYAVNGFAESVLERRLKAFDCLG